MEQRATQATNRDKRKYEERMCVSARIAEKKLRQVLLAKIKRATDFMCSCVFILNTRLFFPVVCRFLMT